MRLPKISIYEPVEESVYNIGEVQEKPYPEGYEEREKYIKKVESLIRNSYEYREYIQFLKDEINLDRCLVLSGLSVDDVSIELHHSFLTLYDIVEIVLTKRETHNEVITPFEIANEVTRLHYQGLVMLTPLSITIHQLVHNGDIFIPIQLQYGDYEEFIKRYKRYISKDLHTKIQKFLELSETFEKDIRLPIIHRKLTYLNIDGVSLPKKIKKEE